MLRRLTLIITALALLAVAGCGDDDSSSDNGDTATTAAETCRDVEAPQPKPDGGQEKPTEKLDASTDHYVVMETSCGDFAIRLHPRESPNAAASFAALVRSGFYDDTIFHRIVPGFVVQGGDPTGTGTGGPGYKTVDTPPADARYTRSVVAMAKTATEAPGTAGSQFYIVTGTDAGLDPDYAIIGMVVTGNDTITRMGEMGDPASGGTGTPTRPVVLERAALRDSL